jgi:hypothetical protein
MTDPHLRRLHRPELEDLATGDDEQAAAAQAEIERRRLKRQSKRSERQKIAPVPEQMSVDEEIEAQEGFDGWNVFSGEDESAA